MNVGVSALAGAVAGGLFFVTQENLVFSFLSFGLLGTAAPFASLMLPRSPIRDAADGCRLIREVTGVLALNVVCCATAAAGTYMLIAGSFFAVQGGAIQATGAGRTVAQAAMVPASAMNV